MFDRIETPSSIKILLTEMNPSNPVFEPKAPDHLPIEEALNNYAMTDEERKAQISALQKELPFPSPKLLSFLGVNKGTSDQVIETLLSYAHEKGGEDLYRKIAQMLSLDFSRVDVPQRTVLFVHVYLALQFYTSFQLRDEVISDKNGNNHWFQAQTRLFLAMCRKVAVRSLCLLHLVLSFEAHGIP